MGKSKKTGRTYKTRGISIDPELLEKAEQRAHDLKMGWSEYVRRCLEADLAKGGDMVIVPKTKRAKSGGGSMGGGW